MDISVDRRDSENPGGTATVTAATVKSLAELIGVESWMWKYI
jgi:hypothetical protein